MNNKTNSIAIVVAISLVAAFLVSGAVMTSGHDSTFAKRYKKTQTTAQDNHCGNGALPLDIFCQTISNQIQGDDNAVNVIALQPATPLSVVNGTGP
jgi:hypothetical protein